MNSSDSWIYFVIPVSGYIILAVKMAIICKIHNKTSGAAFWLGGYLVCKKFSLLKRFLIFLLNVIFMYLVILIIFVLKDEQTSTNTIRNFP